MRPEVRQFHQLRINESFENNNSEFNRYVDVVYEHAYVVLFFFVWCMYIFIELSSFSSFSSFSIELFSHIDEYFSDKSVFEQVIDIWFF